VAFSAMSITVLKLNFSLLGSGSGVMSWICLPSSIKTSIPSLKTVPKELSNLSSVRIWILFASIYSARAFNLAIDLSSKPPFGFTIFPDSANLSNALNAFLRSYLLYSLESSDKKLIFVLKDDNDSTSLSLNDMFSIPR